MARDEELGDPRPEVIGGSTLAVKVIDGQEDGTARGKDFAVGGKNIAREMAFGYISRLQLRKLYGFVDLNVEIKRECIVTHRSGDLSHGSKRKKD